MEIRTDCAIADLSLWELVKSLDWRWRRFILVDAASDIMLNHLQLACTLRLSSCMCAVAAAAAAAPQPRQLVRRRVIKKAGAEAAAV